MSLLSSYRSRLLWPHAAAPDLLRGDIKDARAPLPHLGAVLLAIALAGCGSEGSSRADPVTVDTDASIPLVPTVGDGTPRNLPASTVDFPNPERGSAGWAGDLAETSSMQLRAEVNAGYKLLRSQTLLGDYRTGDLPADYLARLDRGFLDVKSAGAKLVLRFAYVSPPVGFIGEAPDAELPWVLRHIEQLGPVVARHRDVIAWFEAGFIGAWGEWHSSGNGLDSPSAKLAVRDALYAAFPADRAILFRDPADLVRWYPSPSQVPMRTNGGRRAGIHNDCLLSTPTDGNTFPDDSPGLRDYTIEINRLAPYGGETCLIPDALTRASCADILAEGPRYSLSYLNREGAGGGTFQRGWAAQGCLERVSRSIGYRFQLESVTLPASARAGGRLPVSLSVANVGWARLATSRALVLTLTRQSDGLTVGLPVTGTDAAEWPPGGGPIAVDATVALPADLAPGTYTASIALPDPSAALVDDPRYAIRFANADDPIDGIGWDGAHGRYIIGALIIEAD